MKRNDSIYLEDIIDSCEKILLYMEGITKQELQEDTLTQDAIIRNITVIGEATNKMSKDFIQKHPELPIREAVTMRNKLIHDYSFVDCDILWDTAKKDIPQLLKLVRKIIKTTNN